MSKLAKIAIKSTAAMIALVVATDIVILVVALNA